MSRKLEKCMTYTNSDLHKVLVKNDVVGRSNLKTKEQKCSAIVRENLDLPKKEDDRDYYMTNDDYLDCIEHTSCQLTEHLRDSNVHGRSSLTNKHSKCKYIIENNLNLPRNKSSHIRTSDLDILSEGQEPRTSMRNKYSPIRTSALDRLSEGQEPRSSMRKSYNQIEKLSRRSSNSSNDIRNNIDIMFSDYNKDVKNINGNSYKYLNNN